VVTLTLPALRTHPADVPLLAASFVKQLGSRHGRDARLTRDAIDALTKYTWPGNVRELRNALETALVLSSSTEISAADLPDEIRDGKPATRHAAAATADMAGGKGESAFLGEADFREAKRQFEIAFLKRKLEAHRWNVSATAEEIGLHRQSLQEKLRELGIQRPVK
jgi:DNA-binding NtrC family response regulator